MRYRRGEKGQAPLEVIRPQRGRMPRFWRGLPTGQALTEMIIALPVLFILMFGLHQFARISIAKQRLYMAARYGARLMSTLERADDVQRMVMENATKTAVQDYLIPLGDPPAIVNIEWYQCREGVTVTKEIPIMPYLKGIFSGQHTASCYMENDPWEWGKPRGGHK